MPTDAIDRSRFEADVAQHRELSRQREILQGVRNLMFWSAVAAGLFVGVLVHRAGWMPADTYLLTGEYGVFSGGVGLVYLVASVVLVLMQYLRLRATVIGDERSDRIANLTGIAIGVATLLGFVALIAGLFGLFAHTWRGGGETAGSYVTSAVIGAAVVAFVFVGSYLTGNRGMRITAEDDMPYGFVQRALGILIGLPVAALFGFSLSFLAFIALERAGINVEPLRAFFNSQTTLFMALATSAFLLLCGVVHAGRRALRPQTAPAFLATMLQTGLAIIIAKFAFILLIGLKGP